ncbi:hypothetical protein T492DRAFT_1094526 [Pavlovales sp. CCMP2436]|nr:hypothetical protein T492DRAFT_1094526 [Pavlovales sp. CCMP2436]
MASDRRAIARFLLLLLLLLLLLYDDDDEVNANFIINLNINGHCHGQPISIKTLLIPIPGPAFKYASRNKMSEASALA